MNLNHLLALDENKTVILSDEKTISWQQLKQKIISTQQILLKQKANNCALYSYDCEEFIATFLACVFLGIDILLPPNNSPEMVLSLQADILIGGFETKQDRPYKKIALINNKIDSNISIFTSGSTGKPKKITRKLSQLLLEVEELNTIWQKQLKAQVFASTVSYQHIYGLLFSILLPLKNKIAMWHKPLPFEESLEKLQQKYSQTVLVSSPAFLKRLSIKLTNKYKLVVFCSGGVLTPQQHQKAEKQLNSSLFQVYGSSETGGIAYKTEKSFWNFFPSVKYKIVKNSLLIQSPFCYKTQWHDTHDSIKIHNNGFELCGRNDRIVKIEEKRVSLIEIEQATNSHDLIEESYALSINGKRQYIALIVVLSKQGKQQLQTSSEKELKMQIKTYLRTKIEPLAIPKQIRFFYEIPTNSQGKKIHQQLVGLFINPAI